MVVCSVYAVRQSGVNFGANSLELVHLDKRDTPALVRRLELHGKIAVLTEGARDVARCRVDAKISLSVVLHELVPDVLDVALADL